MIKMLSSIDIRFLLIWRSFPANDRLLENPWLLQDRFQISWWDALVVSVAQLERKKGSKLEL